MKVVAIMGSPHKGKGYELVQKVEKELKEFGEVSVTYFFLSETHLEMCKGCFLCISKGAQYCPLKDDRQQLEEEILQADGVILCSPGYVWNVSALMKNFQDRFSYSLHRPIFFNQSLMLIANGGSGLSQVISALTKSLGGSTKVAELKITATPWESNPAYVKKVARNIKQETKSFYQSMLQEQKPTPSFGNLIWFELFKAMAMRSKETLPADYHYYSDKTTYFYETKVNPLLSLLSRSLAKVAIWSMEKQILFR